MERVIPLLDTYIYHALHWSFSLAFFHHAGLFLCFDCYWSLDCRWIYVCFFFCFVVIIKHYKVAYSSFVPYQTLIGIGIKASYSFLWYRGITYDNAIGCGSRCGFFPTSLVSPFCETFKLMSSCKKAVGINILVFGPNGFVTFSRSFNLDHHQIHRSNLALTTVPKQSPLFSLHETRLRPRVELFTKERANWLCGVNGSNFLNWTAAQTLYALLLLQGYDSQSP